MRWIFCKWAMYRQHLPQTTLSLAYLWYVKHIPRTHQQIHPSVVRWIFSRWCVDNILHKQLLAYSLAYEAVISIFSVMYFYYKAQNSLGGHSGHFS